MVMTAVVAESTAGGRSNREDCRDFDFWSELEATVVRAGGDPDRLWVDDSKAIFRNGKGRDRLETACLAAVHAAANTVPSCLAELLEALGAGTLDDVELTSWSEASEWDGSGPPIAADGRHEALFARQPLFPSCARWRIAAVRSVVIGPARFNQGLAAHGVKSAVHFEAFERLLRPIWDRAADGVLTRVCGDKHGGRHYYLPSLSRSFPDAWIDRGLEGADRSLYAMRDGARRLELTLLPRADQKDGLVALASIVSKTVRELWMDAFNSYWRARVPGLRPTAGYHTDATRFRRDIEAAAAAERREPALWWRIK
jgi:hypothetical protein